MDGEREPMSQAWQRHLDECDPVSRADVVRFDHPDRPAMVELG